MGYARCQQVCFLTQDRWAWIVHKVLRQRLMAGLGAHMRTRPLASTDTQTMNSSQSLCLAKAARVLMGRVHLLRCISLNKLHSGKRQGGAGSRSLVMIPFVLSQRPRWAQTEQGYTLLSFPGPSKGGDELTRASHKLWKVWSKAPAMQISFEVEFGG